LLFQITPGVRDDTMIRNRIILDNDLMFYFVISDYTCSKRWHNDQESYHTWQWSHVLFCYFRLHLE